MKNELRFTDLLTVWQSFLYTCKIISYMKVQICSITTFGINGFDYMD